MDMSDDGAQPLYSWLDFHDDARELIARIKESGITITAIVAIPRGGLVLGALLSHAFTVPLHVRSWPEPWDQPTTLVVDDNAITGGSLAPFFERALPCAVLVKHPMANTCEPFFYARVSDEMFLFPWEVEGAREPYDIDHVVAHNCDEPASQTEE